MKIMLDTDQHFCENASIIRKYGTKYSLRIENLLKSINWVQQLLIEKKCDLHISLGDFFNTPTLNEKEITATRDIEWADIVEHFFLVGNHESSISSLQYSSAKALEGPGRTIIAEPYKMILEDCELCFLPYILESDRKPLEDYFGPKQGKRIIFSHNDLLGLQMGPVISKTGFSVEEITASCDLFVNGHLHNGQKITDKIINLGNLTGKDFGEDATKYQHNIMILDTDTLTYELIENPFAFNFYKLEINEQKDIAKLDKLKKQAVMSIKCKNKYLKMVKEKLSANSNVLEYRVIVAQEVADNFSDSLDISELTMDHLAKFVECCMNKIENTPILTAELAEVCK